MDSSLLEWRNMRAVARVVYIIALVFTNATLLAAQTVRGTVVLSDGSTPAASVIVIATDVRGTTAARALTSPAGQFTISVPAGRYGFTLLRIGFRPTRIAEMNINGAMDALHFVLADQPVALSAVNVRERETCRVNADTGFMVARVWEEARKAMLTPQISSEGA